MAADARAIQRSTTSHRKQYIARSPIKQVKARPAKRPCRNHPNTSVSASLGHPDNCKSPDEFIYPSIRWSNRIYPPAACTWGPAIGPRLRTLVTQGCQHFGIQVMWRYWHDCKECYLC